MLVTAADIARVCRRRRRTPKNPLFTVPLERSARVLHRELGPDCDVVLLGSIASPKYVDVLVSVFGDRLRFPLDFVGRGDMSRGGLLLRKADEGAELEYVPVLGATRHGVRPPRLEKLQQRQTMIAAGAGIADARRRCRATGDEKADRDSTRSKRCRPARRWPRGAPHQPAKGLLGGARADERRPAALLRGGGRRAPAASPRSGDGDEALPARRGRRLLFHEARAVAAAGLD